MTAVVEGSDLIIKAADADYFKALDSITINNNSLALDKSDYSVDGDTLTITADGTLTLGETNSIVLRADGYKDARLSVRYAKDLETDLSLSMSAESYQRGDNVVITVNGSDGDYLENLRAVTLHLPNGSTSPVGPKGYYSSTEYYEVDGNTLTIVDSEGTLFDQNGSYTVTLEAQYYNQLTTPAFDVTGEAGGEQPDETMEAPAVVAYEKAGTLNGHKLYFDKTGDNEAAASAYLGAITKVTVGGTAYNAAQSGGWGLAGDAYYIDATSTEKYIELGSDGFASDASTSITIEATGYDPLTVTIDKDGSIVGSEDPGTELKKLEVAGGETDMWNNYVLTFTDEAALDAFFASDNISISVNGTAFTRSSMPLLYDNEYYLNDGTAPHSIDLASNAFYDDRDSTITIAADGYETLTITVDKDGNIAGSGSSVEEPEQPGTELKAVPPFLSFDNDNIGYNGFKQIVFSQNFENEEAVTPYLNAITKVTVANVEYTEASSRYSMADDNYFITTGGIASIAMQSNRFASDANTTIVIEANGYETLTVTVTPDGEIVE